jgi:hypothetical protein
MRLYLSTDISGPYYPAADRGGHGQDLCEFFDPAFRILVSGDITSGGCSECFCDDRIYSVDVPVWYRYDFGDLFEYASVAIWCDDSCYLGCAVDITTEPGATLFCE